MYRCAFVWYAVPAESCLPDFVPRSLPCRNKGKPATPEGLPPPRSRSSDSSGTPPPIVEEAVGRTSSARAGGNKFTATALSVGTGPEGAAVIVLPKRPSKTSPPNRSPPARAPPRPPPARTSQGSLGDLGGPSRPPPARASQGSLGDLGGSPLRSSGGEAAVQEEPPVSPRGHRPPPPPRDGGGGTPVPTVNLLTIGQAKQVLQAAFNPCKCFFRSLHLDCLRQSGVQADGSYRIRCCARHSSCPLASPSRKTLCGRRVHSCRLALLLPVALPSILWPTLHPYTWRLEFL